MLDIQETGRKSRYTANEEEHRKAFGVRYQRTTVARALFIIHGQMENIWVSFRGARYRSARAGRPYTTGNVPDDG